MTQLVASRVRQALAASTDLDPIKSGCLHAALPGLRAALDDDSMGRALQHHLFHDDVSVARCTAGKALYLGAQGCSLRFDLDVRDGRRGSTQRLLVLGRVMEDDDDVARYQRAVAPLAGAVSGRPELASFSRLVASLPQRLVVHAYPIDADLPTLVDATDGVRVAPLLGRPADHLRVTLGRYARRDRCVLRYDIDGGGGRRTVYGKVYADDRGGEVGPVVKALAARLPEDIAVPRFLGYAPALRLSLLEQLPGDHAQAQELVDDAALVAAALHRSEISLGAPRPIEAELAALDDLVLLVARVAPSTGAVLRTLITAITAAAAAAEPLEPVFSHGDFTHSQLLLGGGRRGLVDFDEIAQAEPALDLGSYLAHLRLALAKAQPPAHREAADRLADRFLATYVDAVDAGTGAVALRARAHLYEVLSLLRTTVHAWQQLKAARVRTAFPILCEEVASL